jgi:hypothetical protein
MVPWLNRLSVTVGTELVLETVFSVRSTGPMLNKDRQLCSVGTDKTPRLPKNAINVAEALRTGRNTNTLLLDDELRGQRHLVNV